MATIKQMDKVPFMGVKFWKAISKKIGGTGKWVYKDGEKGLMQNNTQKHRLSPQYKKYKDNDMNRFTDGKRLGASPFKGRSLKTRKFPLVSRSLHTIGTPHVTMILTGDTIGGLHGEKFKRDGMTMAFELKDSDKITRNKARGYDITGLNTKNIRLIKVEMIKQFKKNKVKFIPKNIVINVGK